MPTLKLLSIGAIVLVGCGDTAVTIDVLWPPEVRPLVSAISTTIVGPLATTADGESSVLRCDQIGAFPYHHPIQPGPQLRKGDLVPASAEVDDVIQVLEVGGGLDLELDRARSGPQDPLARLVHLTALGRLDGEARLRPLLEGCIALQMRRGSLGDSGLDADLRESYAPLYDEGGETKPEATIALFLEALVSPPFALATCGVLAPNDAEAFVVTLYEACDPLLAPCCTSFFGYRCPFDHTGVPIVFQRFDESGALVEEAIATTDYAGRARSPFGAFGANRGTLRAEILGRHHEEIEVSPGETSVKRSCQ